MLAEDDDGDDKIIIFSTDANIRHLSEADKIYDSTFQTCPRLFHQICTVHAFINEKQFPFVYCLLPGNSRAIYQQTLEIIGGKAEELGLELCPDEVLTDFELATI